MKPKATTDVSPIPRDLNPSRILSVPDDGPCLDTVELNRLEHAFRTWADDVTREDIRLSRRRILLVFLIIRYTAAKLNEVLALDPLNDIDAQNMTVSFRLTDKSEDSNPRTVEIPEPLTAEILETLRSPLFQKNPLSVLGVDPGFVRRKFYERAQACGFQKHMGGPEMIRRARAVELMRSSMPLPAVQMMLGHSTPNLTSAYVSFSKDEVRKMTRLFMDREASRKTSARNSFFGKVSGIEKGDIQSRVTLTTLYGDLIATIITNDSLDRLGINEGSLVTAEIKAPWVILQKGSEKPRCSADNILKGVISRISRGKINTEYAVRLEDGTEMCSIVATEGVKHLEFAEGDPAWILFTCFAVVLHVD